MMNRHPHKRRTRGRASQARVRAWDEPGERRGVSPTCVRRSAPPRLPLATRRRARRHRPGQPAGRTGALAADAAARPQFAPKAKRVVQLFMAGGGQPHRSVRLQAGAGQAARPAVATSASTSRRFRTASGPWLQAASGTSSRTASAASCSARSSRRSGAVRRRHRVRPQRRRQDRRPQPGDAAADDRLSTAPASPAWAAGSATASARMNENLPTFVVLPDHRGLASNGTKNWDSRVPARPSTRARSSTPARKTPIADLFPDERGDFITRGRRRAPRIDLLGAAQPRARRRPARRRPARRPHPQLRAGRQDAARRPRGARPLEGAGARPEAVRPRPRQDVVRQGDQRRSRRPTTSAASAWSPGGCWSAACGSCRSGSGNDNGFPRRNWDSHEDVQPRPRPAGRRHGPRRGGPDPGPEAARPARRHDHPLDDRVRPHARLAGRQGPRPQPVLLHQLAVRRRHQGRRHATARATSGATSRSTASTRPRSTTSTPRSCTCSASTTRS